MSGLHNNNVFTTNFSSGDYNFSNSYDTTWEQPLQDIGLLVGHTPI